MRDLIGDVLSSVELSSALYFRHGFSKPWGMNIPKGPFAQFHLLVGGNCILELEDQSLKLGAGDMLLFPHGDAHQVKDQTNSLARPGKEVVQEILASPAEAHYSDIHTDLICGHFEWDREIGHPLLDNLPSCLIIRRNEYNRSDLLQSISELIIEEMGKKESGYQMISLRLAEILYILLIRHYYKRKQIDVPNILSDKQIYQAINFIHNDLARNWNIHTLSKMVGISRTLFIERFREAVGITPMKYISQWRMNKAKYLIKTTDLSLNIIGEQVGYSSEASFNRAFKQTFSISPGKYKRKLITAPTN